MDSVNENEQMMTTTKLAKLLYSLCIWSLALIGVMKMYSTPQLSVQPTDSTKLSLVNNKSVAPDYDTVIKDIEARIPSLPLSYWHKNEKRVSKMSSKCAKYPSIFELQFNNVYWQTLHSSNGTFQLYGAYYDMRKDSTVGPSVRLLGMLDRIEPKVKTHCQFWYEGKRKADVMPAIEYKYIWVRQWGNYRQGIYQPYLITCKLPKINGTDPVQPPSSVSLVENKCDRATNNLRVIFNRPEDKGWPKKKGFTVCVKGLDFLYDDLSVRLVEWIELLLLLGADKINFYELQVHPNIAKVLQHYQRSNKVHIMPLTLPGSQPNIAGFQHLYLKKKTAHKRQNEIIPYNDCLYKNIYLYDYVTLLDIDEVIMPKAPFEDWFALIARIVPDSLKLKPQGYDSYHFRNVYFLDNQGNTEGNSYDGIPEYMHMLQHVYRSKNFSRPNDYVKSFHSTERVLTLHNHFPRACLRGSCRSYPVNTTIAQMQHYRADCVKELQKKCAEYRANSVKDNAIWQYKTRLIEKTRATLLQLGMLH